MASSSDKATIMRALGKDLAFILQYLSSRIVAGQTTGLDVDRWAAEVIDECGARSSCLGYSGFPASICLSVNDQIVHGIPSARTLQTGDLLTLDLAINRDGYHVDSAVTIVVGGPEFMAASDAQLLKGTYDALLRGIDAARPGSSTLVITKAIQYAVESAGLTAVTGFCGHKIGERMHDGYSVYNSDSKGNKYVDLSAGETLAIEPIVKHGTDKFSVDPDGWTVRAADKKKSAQFEHTVLVTDEGPEVLTAWQPGFFERVVGFKP